MKILDLRPALVRHFSRRPPAVSRALARPIDHLVGGFLNHRVSARPAPPASPFLVSVGNLALGGTGKTPVVMALSEAFARRGVSGAILTRGYGSSLAGPVDVQPSDDKAGDEARLMASRLNPHGWPVIQARRRRDGLVFLRDNHESCRLAFLEDAHQSAGLPRHLDLLILDAWDEGRGPEGPVLIPRTGPVFPLGPWREDARGAERAAAILVESTDPVPARTCHGQPVFRFSRRQVLRHPGGADGGLPDPSRWGLISGIARPEAFEAGAVQTLPGELALSIRCKDHAPYGPALLRRMCADLDDAGVEAVATTAKDWVKLQAFWPSARPLWILDLELVWEDENAPTPWLGERAGIPEVARDQSGFTAP